MKQTFIIILVAFLSLGCTAGDEGDMTGSIELELGSDGGMPPPPPPTPMHDAGVAPGDAPRPTSGTTQNPSRPDYRLLGESLRSPPTKADQIKKRGALDATALPVAPPVNQRTQTNGGTCAKVSDLPDGYLVGSSGAGPCIIAVITNCDGSIVACHFYTSDDAAASLALHGPFGECAHAAIAGGDGSAQSNMQLSLVLAELDRLGIPVDGILDRIGVFWDATNGRWVYGPRDGASIPAR